MDPAYKKGVHILILKLLSRSLGFIDVPDQSALHPDIVEKIRFALRRVKTNKSTIVLWDLNAHVGNDVGVWKGVTDRHGDTDDDDQGWCLLQLCHNNALCVMNAFCQHTDVHKYSALGAEIRWINSHSLISTWYQLTFSVQCSTFVTKSAELSSGHHVLVCNLHWMGHQGLFKRAGPGDPT